MVEFVGLLICVPLWSILVLIAGASVTAGLFIFHVAVVPLIFKYSKTFRRNLVFLNFVQWPLFIDFEEPSASGLEGARNLSIEYHSKVDDCKVKIGIWHILPKSVYERSKGSFVDTADKEDLNRIMDEELAKSKLPIMMYCHGNSNSRGATHRISLYKFFQKMDYHTIAFDYRGYGDSTSVRPSEAGVVEDSLIVYEWILNTITKDSNEKSPPVFVWGHSLGTGISSHLLGNLEALSKSLLDRPALPLPKGLILEAPFNNLADEVAHHPASILVTWLPYHDATFVEPFRKETDFKFLSDQHLTKQRQLPILILHAKDDAVVPFRVGLKLYRSILASRSETDAAVKLQAYEKNLNLGHKWICDAPDLHTVIGDFVTSQR
ncbi:serine aminopeptidase, s33 domain-containing protein [Phthorimaea operculella]|nr:serine aminopeptidase, s33 domain-containing protein [Phthorimaea operculella]